MIPKIRYIILTGLIVLLSAVNPSRVNATTFLFDHTLYSVFNHQYNLSRLQTFTEEFTGPVQDTSLLAKQAEKERRKIEKQRKREEKRAEALEKNPPIPNPNHADVILLGKNLPPGRPLLQTIAGRVPGMMIDGDNVMTRGPSSFTPRSDPLFIIDGVPASKELANSISVEQIDRIEIFTGPSAAIYGTRASNGVISIYLKNSGN